MQGKAAPTGKVVVVEDPTEDLPFAAVEGQSVQFRHADAIMLRGSAATREAIGHLVRDCEVFHFAGHGTFDDDDPLFSALKLEDLADSSKWLSLRQIICDLRMVRNRLTILSGCETGLLNPDKLDEYVSLPAGFLYAGARCVVSTLWELNDLAAALVLDRFYAGLNVGLGPAAALREAQIWLRDRIGNGKVLCDYAVPRLLKRIARTDLREECMRMAHLYAEQFPNEPPFASPVDWAPFAAAGLAYDLAGDRRHVALFRRLRSKPGPAI